jgi:hypothetical protein
MATAASGQRDIEIELTQIRYRCSDLFRRIREEGHQSALHPHFRDEIRLIRESTEDAAFAGHPILELIQQEIPSLLSALELIERECGAAYSRRNLSHHLTSQLLQHEAYVALGRGVSHPIRAAAAAADEDVDMTMYAGLGPSGATTPTLEDPIGVRGPNSQNALANTSYMSPLSSTQTRRVAMQLRSASSARQ